jgi:hypothetical protein
MDFVGGLPMMWKGNEYLFVVVGRFKKMCILMPCKNTIKGWEATNLLFKQVWVYFGIPRSIISDRESIFLSAFFNTLWEKMDTKLNRSTKLHP